ncbi:MAG: M42 family metallopeptidase [bacterium]|nr:M42 family metallopeptidase [bacterium]
MSSQPQPPALSIDTQAAVDFLVGLLNTPSPTGYHVEAIDYTRQAFEAMGIPGLTLWLTRKGALMMKLPGQKSDAPVGITAHIDTLGLMVKEIKSNGRLRCTNLGGILWGSIESELVTVRTHDNRRYRGSIAPANTSVHVNRRIQSLERDGDSMEVRLDVRTTSAKETRALGIDVGDFVFVDPRVEVTEAGFIRSRFLDDKAGVAGIYGALRALKDGGMTPVQDSYFLIANYEEVGHGGAAGFPADLAELLTIDMGALGEGQAGDEFSVSICVKDGGGPYHFDMNNKLRRLCEQHEIPFNMDIYVYYSSDGTAFWRAGGDAKVGLAGPGVDASHAYERTHRESIQHTAHLIARYLLDG